MPRVVVLSERDEILLVHHNQGPGDQFWVIPGGDVDPGETSLEAALREVREETGVVVRIERLLWLVEEVDTHRRLRSHPYYLGVPVGGVLVPGSDPERPRDAQVIDDARFFTQTQIASLDRVYPEILRREFWALHRAGHIRLPRDPNPTYRTRPSPGFGLEQ